MEKSILFTAALLATLVVADGASAKGYRWSGATDTPRIDATRAEQRKRIEEGRRNGQITRSEYNRLMAEQDRIATMERRAKADGIATPSERREIRHAQEEAARHIYQESHNGETRWNRWYRRWW
jgi:protein required for attachment to host cells